MAEEEQKHCFIIGPIGSPDSDIRNAADYFREDIVKATLGDQYEVKRADDYSSAGNITSQVIVAIKNADLIIADLTNRNANVYYELGVAHSYVKHVIPAINIDVDSSSLPFDNLTERTIHYSFKTVAARNAARQSLAVAVEETLKGDVSNPVTTALGLAKAAAEGDNTGQLLEQLVRSNNSLELRLETQARQIQELARNMGLRQPTRQQAIGDIVSEVLARETAKSRDLNQAVADLLLERSKQTTGLINSPFEPPQPDKPPPPNPRPPQADKK